VDQCVAVPVCSSGQFCWESPLPQGNALLGSWASSASEVWAAGKLGNVLHWNGSVWSGMPTASTATWNGIWGADPSHVWVVGGGGEISLDTQMPRGCHETKHQNPKRYLESLIERLAREHAKASPAEPFQRPGLPKLAQLLGEAGYVTPEGHAHRWPLRSLQLPVA
jgi:hypothetical protein